MTYTLIILVYIANVFVSRWLNKIAYKLENKYPIINYWWFVPAIPIIGLIVAIIIAFLKQENKVTTWFTGKHW